MPRFPRFTSDILPDLESAHRHGRADQAYLEGACPASLPDGWRFVSRCTQPDFAGRGHARRLTRALLSRHRRRGVGSFLHVSEGNVGARRLYESMGFVVRASLLMCKVERIAAQPWRSQRCRTCR
jgi:GNAT superfamily N-acetyltransferase